MTDELNVPTHRWHVPQNNISLPNNEFSRDWISANGIAKIDRQIARLVIDPLFANGEPGIALDPNDPDTLFQDTAGTTPVTTPGQSVALALDKSKGLVLGSELWANQTPTIFDFSGTVGAYNTLTRTMSNTGATFGGYPRFQFNLGLVSGRTYLVSGTLSGSLTQIAQIRLASSGLSNDIPYNSTTGVFFGRVVAAAASLEFVTSLSGANAVSISNISVRELPGNHATQATAGSQPVYASLPANGVRNLANGSASVGNTTFWPASALNNGITATKVASGFDVDGLPYVDVRYQGTATDTFHGAVYADGNSRAAAASGQTFTASCVFRFISGSLTGVTGMDARTIEETSPATFVGQTIGNFVTASTDAISTSTRTITTGNQARLAVVLVVTNGATIDVTYRIKAIQLELGSTRTAYQFNYSNVNIAQPPFAQVGALLFDGVDDFLQTPSVDFSTTDKMTVFAGVRKLSDANFGIVAELTADLNSNNGAFYLIAPGGVNSPSHAFGSKGTLAAVPSATGVPAPITSVLTGAGNISGDVSTLRRNGAQVAQATNDQGTGNYANAPIYIGRRAGSTLPLNGYLYSLIVRGAATSDNDIARTEAWINSVTGAY